MAQMIASTADLARVLDQTVRRVDNDMQHGYLPLGKAVGRGRSRNYTIQDARACALHYEMRDRLGISASIARDLMPSLLWLDWSLEDTICAVYFHEGRWHGEVTSAAALFEIGAFSVFPAAPGEGGQQTRVDAVGLINSSGIVRRIDERVAALA